jgi:dolichol-phosphate mannosyltransferase
MQYAIQHDYRFLINLDADLSHPARYLPDLVNAVQEADVAVGSRYVKGGGVVGWPIHRKIMSRGVNAFARLVLGLPTRDCSGSFRCYRVAKLREISFDRVRSKGYSFFEEILWHLRHARARFVEVPITFQDRQKGNSKIDFREAITAVGVIASLAFRSPKSL